MAVQTLIGTSSLVSVGVGAGDVATLYTVGRRIGNWLTASGGDADLLAMLEEDEASILRRRGTIDLIAFQRRWGRSLRLLENGRPQRVEGQAVEKLLENASRFTAIMICIVAVLDEFAAESAVRTTVRDLLQRLLGSTEIINSLLISQVGNRVNAWRSAAAVREMNIYCRKFRDSMIRQGFAVQGYLPKDEINEVVDFLQWLLAGDTNVKYTSSSDVAGIAHCLTHLSFEILTIENFAPSPWQETPCRLVYSKAPLYSFPGEHHQWRTTVADWRNSLNREASTIVSLTQLDETFSTFPIQPGLANRCRAAWQDGMKTGQHVLVNVSVSYPGQAHHSDIHYDFVTKSSHLQVNRRFEPGILRIAEAIGIFISSEILERLSSCLGRESEQTLRVLHEILSRKMYQTEPTELQDPKILEAFTVCQAFAMGYFYEVFLKFVDSSMLQMKTVSGKWGYQSATFMSAICHIIRMWHGPDVPHGGKQKETITVSRKEVLSILTCLCADHDGLLQDKILQDANWGPYVGDDCIGYVGKRILLINSLLKSPTSISGIGGFTILDVDAGGIPRDAEGCVVPSIPTGLRTWEDTHPPRVNEHIDLSGPPEDFTRHIEPDWDGVPERLLLCIRYKGRRIGSLNPRKADFVFCRTWSRIEQIDGTKDRTIADDETILERPLGPAYECGLDDFIFSDRLVTPGRGDTDIPVIVQSKNSPCMRYAVAAWYSDHCKVAPLNTSIREAVRNALDLTPTVIEKKAVALIG